MSQALPRPKVVILGLDGVCWSQVQRLAAQGTMPRLGALTRDSFCGPMLSTRPEISPVAWTTFFTARPPGHHGIYGFTEFEPGSYQIRYNSSAQVRVPFIWDRLGLGNRRSVALNIPLTYPARPLAGIMVSGFVALDYDRAAYPGWVAQYLRETGYRLEADFEKVRQDREAFLADLDQALGGRSRLLERFWPEDWDLFALVITDTDRLHHFFWQESEEDGPISEYFQDFFRRVDEIVGRVFDLAGDLAGKENEDVYLVMLSDHGFTGVKKEFHLNRWLAAQGFQAQAGPKSLALALDPTRIYLNRPPRFAQGRVSPAEISALSDRIRAGLMDEPAVAGVISGQDIFAGPALALAPDLVVRPAPGYEFKAKFTPGPVYTPSPLQGTHTYEDAFFLVHDFRKQIEEPKVKEILALGEFVASLFDL